MTQTQDPVDKTATDIPEKESKGLKSFLLTLTSVVITLFGTFADTLAVIHEEGVKRAFFVLGLILLLALLYAIISLAKSVPIKRVRSVLLASGLIGTASGILIGLYVIPETVGGGALTERGVLTGGGVLTSRGPTSSVSPVPSNLPSAAPTNSVIPQSTPVYPAPATPLSPVHGNPSSTSTGLVIPRESTSAGAPQLKSSATTVPTGLPCPPSGETGAKDAVLKGQTVSPSLSIGPAYYKAVIAGNLQLEFGVRLRGASPSGTKLYVIGQVGPTSDVTTHPRNPGTGLYYRYDKETSLDLGDNTNFSGGCYVRKYGPASPANADGITFRQWFILVNDDRVSDFFNSKPDGGYSDADLDSLGVTRLAYFDVPTD